MQRTNTNSGFTLIELMTVISIISMLASIVLASVSTARSKGTLAASQQFAATIDHSVGDVVAGAYKFDACSGSTINDDSGNQAVGSVSNGSAVYSNDTPFTTGCSLNLTGGKYIDVPYTTGLPIGNSSRTITAWIKPTAVQNGWGNIFSYGKGDCPALQFGMGFMNTSQMNLTFWGGCKDFISGLSVPLDTWTFVAVSYEPPIVTLYVNNKSQSYNFGSGINTQQSDLYIGAEQRNDCKTSCGGSFTGMIDNFRVYGRSLTAQAIYKQYAQEASQYNHIAVSKD